MKILLPSLITVCCQRDYIENTEYLIDRQWWGRCNACEKMSELEYVKSAKR